ncbi:hypothetical protein [uncultured Clostridium sp.]|jgi:hypothetical protein|uniref:hypothetical protein n=1 Tax=uncultured Clostridium sp. TaxID=59620 RepID=UPI002637311B|nr:hypothetical protein [uncultured Clostridium sp.]
MNNKQKKTTHRRTRFNFFKFLRNMTILAIIIFAGYWVISALFTSTEKPLPKVVTAPTKISLPKPVAINPVQEYKAKQDKIINSIFRFNENLYMSMNNNNVVNLYPDSQNAVTALNDNLSSSASKLQSSDVRAESLFLSELTLKNNAYINAVIAYNKEALVKVPNPKNLKALNITVQKSYNDINTFMNKNLSLFK